MKLLEVLGTLGAVYGACLALAVAVLVTVMAITHDWSAAPTGTAMMAMLYGLAGTFLLADVAVFLYLRHRRLRLGWNLSATAALGSMLTAFWLILAFLSLVIFNR
ncbi:MAG TPA: hypothetical protein PLY66_09825 [Acidobacteriota bacterium]|nr:hypothetical protein [Acidobacteriota bacterium]HOT01291.1 hypothetical protein [Acidobacteriota bacterium]HQF87471.1 hypothetical protein [Acidobacteriota bacterium]HQG93388.1 hypothetical protein [Acidobacteriota bacterium]HQK88126.1 hypothetical protein [Acidobacteriota bacterium]